MEEEPVLPKSEWEPLICDPGLFLDSNGVAADGREDDDVWKDSRSEVSNEATNPQVTEDMYLMPRDPAESKRKENSDTDDKERKRAFVEKGVPAGSPSRGGDVTVYV